MAADIKHEIWDALHDLVRERGGSIISIRNKFPATILCPQGSTLPEELRRYARYTSRKQHARMPDKYGFDVELVGSRGVINPVGLEVVTAGARSSDPPLRVEHHAKFVSMDEFEVSLRRVM